MNRAACLDPLPSPTEMAAWDKAAISLGLPEAMLMENAARAAFDALREHFRPKCFEGRYFGGMRIMLFMGGGNNGGDAACLARHLLDAGALPLTLHVRPLGAYRGSAARHIAMARACGAPFMPAARLEAALRACPDPDIVVDGLVGSGLSGPLKAPVPDLIREINRLGKKSFVLALDIPSGLDGLSGKPRQEAVRADLTVTFQAAKPGLVLPEAAAFTGRLAVRPIGIPRRTQNELAPSMRLLNVRGCRELLARGAGAAFSGPAPHKGVFGHVLTAGGSPGLTGAPHLAALAALRCGAGLATVAAPARICAQVKAGNPDIMTLPLACGENWEGADAAALHEIMDRCRSLIIGPGLGRSQAAGEITRKILACARRPAAVIDADALWALAGFSAGEIKATVRAGDVLTPHPGEAARLLGVTAEQVQGARPDAALALARKYACHVILKGAGSLLAAEGLPLCLAPYDAPQLAVAGSGDVLAGAVAALLAGGENAFGAAAGGVMLHVLAGRLLAKDFPARGNTASDIAGRLPRALAVLLRRRMKTARDFHPEPQWPTVR